MSLSPAGAFTVRKHFLKLIRIIVRGLLSILDIFVAVPLTILILVEAVIFRIVNRTRRKRIALLVPGADLTSIHRKYGTLNVYFRDNPSNYFEHCYRFLMGPNNCRLELREDFTVYERKIPANVMKLTYLAKLVLEISALTLRNRVAILHARDPYYCGLVMWAVSNITRTPFCVSLHADYDLAYATTGRSESQVILGSRAIAKKLERFVLSHAPMVLPIRESIAKYAIGSGARPDRIRIIPHGIDLTPYKSDDGTECRKLFQLDDKKVVCSVGRLTKYNYPYDVIEVARLINQKRNDTIFFMVGIGSERSNLEAKCRELNLTDSVRFVGFQPQQMIPSIRMMADVNLCLMAGFSLIEACAAGRPVIAYDVDWHYELVKNGETGYLVPEKNVEAVAEAICQIIDNPERSKVLGENARRLAFERHSMEKTNEIKVRAYEELLRLQG